MNMANIILNAVCSWINGNVVVVVRCSEVPAILVSMNKHTDYDIVRVCAREHHMIIKKKFEREKRIYGV